MTDQEATTDPGDDRISSLTGEALDHIASGNREAAHAAFKRRDAIARKESGETPASASQEAEPGGEAEPPAEYDFADMSDVAAMLSEFPGEAGAALVDEWGGPDSPTFQENIRHAMAAVTAYEEKIPGLKDALNLELTGPGGISFQLGNDPLVLKLAAMLGREFADRDRERAGSQARNVDAPPPRSTLSGRSAEAVQADIDRLNEQVPPGSRKYVDPKHQRRLAALYGELTGDSPIVGARMRTI